MTQVKELSRSIVGEGKVAGQLWTLKNEHLSQDLAVICLNTCRDGNFLSLKTTHHHFGQFQLLTFSVMLRRNVCIVFTGFQFCVLGLFRRNRITVSTPQYLNTAVGVPTVFFSGFIPSVVSPEMWLGVISPPSQLPFENSVTLSNSRNSHSLKMIGPRESQS